MSSCSSSVALAAFIVLLHVTYINTVSAGGVMPDGLSHLPTTRQCAVLTNKRANRLMKSGTFLFPSHILKDQADSRISYVMQYVSL
jgi:hypothetical protein